MPVWREQRHVQESHIEIGEVQMASFEGSGAKDDAIAAVLGVNVLMYDVVVDDGVAGMETLVVIVLFV